MNEFLLCPWMKSMIEVIEHDQLWPSRTIKNGEQRKYDQRAVACAMRWDSCGAAKIEEQLATDYKILFSSHVRMSDSNPLYRRDQSFHCLFDYPERLIATKLHRSKYRGCVRSIGGDPRVRLI